MIDETSPDAKQTAAWPDHLAPGDIVSFRFPIRRFPGQTNTPKTRPCLVLERVRKGDKEFVALCYGTSVPNDMPDGFDIAIASDDAARACGLHRPTRFSASRRIVVPIDDRGFVAKRRTGSPVLGTMSPEVRPRLDEIRARIDIHSHGRNRRKRRATPPFRRRTCENAR